MGRNRTVQDEDAPVVNFLLWYGENSYPIGFAPEADYAREGADWAALQALRAEKIRLHDQSFPGEADMVRRPYGATSAID